MDKTIQFQHFPTIEALSEAIGDLKPPYSVEIIQEVMKTYGGRTIFAFSYREIIDCDTINDLHDFLCDEELGLPESGPFTIVIGPAEEEDEDFDDDDDHPSLTAVERNPSLQ